MLTLLGGLPAEDDLKARLERGMAAAAAGDCETAVPQLAPVARANPKLAPALNALGVCEARLGHLDRANALFRKLVELEPSVWQGWNNLGGNYLALGSPREAAEAFQKGLKLNPGAASMWFQLGIAESKLGLLPDAFKAFDKAQQLAPKDREIVKHWVETAEQIASRAAELINQRKYAEALPPLRLVRRPLEVSASWHNLSGYAEFKAGEPAAALTHLKKALDMEPDNEDYLADVGEFLASHDANQQLLEVFEVAAKRLPHSSRVKFGLAVAYILQDRRDEATERLETLVHSDPAFEPAYRALGECYEDASRFDDMITLGRRLQQVNPRNQAGFYLEGAGALGRSRRGERDVEQALSALSRSIELDPSMPRSHFQLARAYEEAGRIGQAVESLKKTIELDPQHGRAHYVLGRLYQRLGEPQLAKQELEAHRRIKEEDRKATYRRLLIVSRNQ